MSSTPKLPFHYTQIFDDEKYVDAGVTFGCTLLYKEAVNAGVLHAEASKAIVDALQ
jgi:hypothetical protein